MHDQLLTSYMGIPTFFSAPHIDIDQIEPEMTVVAGVPIDQGGIQVPPGARYGPRAIRSASLVSRGLFELAEDQTIFDVDKNYGLKLKQNLALGDLGDFLVNPTDIAKTNESVIEGVRHIVRNGGLPLIIGGDHSVAFPSFTGFSRGMSERKPNVRLGYLHIDSHPDFRDSHGPVGKYTQGTCVRRISEDPTISYRNMAWLGLNGLVLTADMYRLRQEKHLKMVSVKDLEELGVQQTISEVMEVVAEGVDAVYVSIDIDVVRGSEAPATGAIVFSGISASTFLEIMTELSNYPVIRAVDLCEVAPSLDTTERTATLAVGGLLSLFRNRLFEQV
jgi:arginase family enzyme